jgi:hypothetical protein
MQEERDLAPADKDEQTEFEDESNEHLPPEIAEHPVPGIKHKREPDAENIMPIEDGPGTL